MIRHGSASHSARTAAFRVTFPYVLLPKITVADASFGQVLLSANRMKYRQDAPFASSRTFSATNRGTLKTNPTAKFPQATA
jgi:hypothetical protein